MSKDIPNYLHPSFYSHTVNNNRNKIAFYSDLNSDFAIYELSIETNKIYKKLTNEIPQNPVSKILWCVDDGIIFKNKHDHIIHKKDNKYNLISKNPKDRLIDINKDNLLLIVNTNSIKVFDLNKHKIVINLTLKDINTEPIFSYSQNEIIYSLNRGDITSIYTYSLKKFMEKFLCSCKLKITELISHRDGILIANVEYFGIFKPIIIKLEYLDITIININKNCNELGLELSPNGNLLLCQRFSNGIREVFYININTLKVEEINLKSSVHWARFLSDKKLIFDSSNEKKSNCLYSFNLLNHKEKK